MTDVPPTGGSPSPPPPPKRRSRRGPVLGLLAAGGAAVVALVAVLVGAVPLARGPGAAFGPRVGDHWHVRYGVYVCDRFLAPVQGDRDFAGIHSHGDGMIHVEPNRRSSAGRNATFRRFEDAQGLRISSSSLLWVDGSRPVRADAGDGCGARPARLVTFVDGRRRTGAPGSIRLRDGREIIVALVPEGTGRDELGQA